MTFWPFTAPAIYIGNLTFSMPEDEIFVAKNVLNNNKSARVYQIDIIAIDSPGEQETRTRPADGELLYAPKSLALSAGNSDFFKFYYHGPPDDKERYYRVSFREIPPESRQISVPHGGISMEPIVIMDAILVVRPRNSNFKWALNKQTGALTNSGNTYFKLILKPGCQSTEEDGNTYYLRPGDTLHDPLLQQPGEKYIVYNDNFISLTDGCPQ
ncbi:fimbria/pilus periplasmic chaperone [Morganella morganii]